MVGGGMVGGGGGSVVSGGRGVGLGLGVDSGSLVGDISDISVITVAGVLHVLDSAVRKGNRVRSGNVGGTIGLLLSVEVGLGVVISDGIGEGVGGNLIRVGLGLVGGGSVTSIRAGSHDGEESSSDESLHFCSIG